MDGALDSARVDSALNEGPATVPRTAAELTDRDLAVLAFEHRWFRSVGAKEEGIRIEFGLSAARYYQLLAVLLDSPRALAEDPLLINRLQRMRDARARARAGRSLNLPD